MVVIKRLLQIIGVLLHYICSYKAIVALRAIGNHIYSGWIKMQLGKVGDHFLVSGPLYLRGGKFIYVGSNFHALERLRLEAVYEHNQLTFQPSIKIGDRVSFNQDCHIACINRIEIGNDVLFASKIFITDHYHGAIQASDIAFPPNSRPLSSKGPVIVEDNVWIGEGVVILPGVIIGKNSIVGANSVVTKNIPANSVVGGNPAKIIRSF